MSTKPTNHLGDSSNPSFASRDTVVPAPGAVPLLGHLWRLLRDPLSFMDQCRKIDDIVEIREGPARSYLLCRPELAKEVMARKAHCFSKGIQVDRISKFTGGNGLFECHQDEHRWQRRLMQPAFTLAHIERYAEVMSEEAHQLERSWKPGQEFDVLRVMKDLTLRIIIRAMLPSAAGRHVEELAQAIETVMAGIFIRIVAAPLDLMHLDLIYRIPTPANRRFDRAMAQVWKIAEEFVANARREHRAGTANGGLLVALLEASERDGEGGFDSRGLWGDQVYTLLLAGSETASTTLSWAFHLLSVNAEVEQRLHAEVDEALAGRPATANDLPRLAFTDQVITETLRMYPPVWLLDRRALHDVELAGRRFAADTRFFISPYMLHRDPEAFSAPGRFDPDRWGPSRIETIPRNAYLPFGAGNRKCIGANFGRTEATIALATLAARWRLRPVAGSTVRPLARAPLIPQGLRMTVERRG